MSGDRQGGMTKVERDSVGDLAAPRTRVIYEVVRRQGDEELRRPSSSLFWSGVAGGITIMASVIAQAALRHKLPADMPLRQVISDTGYSLGFVMVILGRMQLFTEQTIVTVLPIMAAPSWRKLAVTARLWAIVFLANMVGSCAAAAINVNLHLMSQDLLAPMLEVSGALLRKAPLEVLLQGIPAGFLIASVAWIRAGVSVGEFWVVLVLTYAIALGDFTHVVAGGAEAFLLLFAGQIGVGQAVGASSFRRWSATSSAEPGCSRFSRMPRSGRRSDVPCRRAGVAELFHGCDLPRGRRGGGHGGAVLRRRTDAACWPRSRMRRSVGIAPKVAPAALTVLLSCRMARGVARSDADWGAGRRTRAPSGPIITTSWAPIRATLTCPKLSPSAATTGLPSLPPAKMARRADAVTTIPDKRGNGGGASGAATGAGWRPARNNGRRRMLDTMAADRSS